MEKSLSELLDDISIQQKKGLSFILASICIWIVITVISFLPIELMYRNIAVLSCGALLFPVSIFWSKVINVNMFYKDNPLINGLLIATNNQILYLLICIILLIKAPALVLPAYALIYGAHLLPYSFFYQSKAYKNITIFICAAIMVVLVFLRLDVRLVPIIVEIGVILLAIFLNNEIKQLKNEKINI